MVKTEKCVRVIRADNFSVYLSVYTCNVSNTRGL